MGNSLKCYAEDEEVLLEDSNPRQLLIDEYGGSVSLSVHQGCATCDNYFQQLEFGNLLSNIQVQHSEEQPTQLSFSEPFAFPCNDKIMNYTTSYFQLAISQQQQRCLPKTIKQFSRYFPETFECSEKEILFCLKEQIWEFFACYNLEQHRFSYYRQFKKNKSIISMAAQIFCQVTHICQSIKLIFLSNFKKNEFLNNLTIYVKLYHKYQNAIQNIYKQNQYLDLINALYDQQFQVDSSQEVNKTFIGYCMRCWSQIVLSESICDELIDAYRNTDPFENSFLIYQYTNSVIDVSSNENSINWLGHSKKMKLNQRLIDLNVNKRFFMDNTKSEEEKENQLKQLKFSCPQWFYEIYYDIQARQQQIQTFMNEISKKKKIPLKIDSTASSLKQSTIKVDDVINKIVQISCDEFCEETQASQQSKIAALYIQNFLSLEETSESLPINISLSVSLNALKISEEIDTNKLFNYNQQFLKVKMNIERRDYTLEQRKKLISEKNLDFFESFKLNKYNTKEEEQCATDIYNEYRILKGIIKQEI